MNNYIGYMIYIYMIYIHVQYLPQITLHRILSTSWTPNNTYHPSGHRRPPAASPSRAARRQHLLRLRCAAGRWPRGDLGPGCGRRRLHIGGGDVEGWRKRRTKGGELLGWKLWFYQQKLKKHKKHVKFRIKIWFWPAKTKEKCDLTSNIWQL